MLLSLRRRGGDRTDRARDLVRRLGLLFAILNAILVTSPAVAEDTHGAFCDRVRLELGGEIVPAERIPPVAVIGDIELRILDVFEAQRDGERRVPRLPYRIANRLHVNTRPPVIERELLFESGDPYDPRTLEESERNLRDQSNVYDACIAPVRVRGREVDVVVVTRDVWTLGARASFGRSGEANTIQFGLEDSNFLGSGRLVDLKYTDDPDRTERRFRYHDPALFGSRAELAVKLAERSDGHRYTLDAGRPFFSFDARWSAGTRVVSDEALVRLYSRGEVVDRFVLDAQYVELRGGLSRGFDGAGAHRFFAGFTWDERRYDVDPFPLASLEPVPRHRVGIRGRAGTAPDPSTVPALAPPPGSRTIAYPWIGWQWIEDGYVERHNMDRLARTEDWNLGMQWNARAGWSSPAWGSDRSQAIVALDWTDGFATERGRHLVLFGASAGGRIGSGEIENALGGAHVRHYFSNLGLLQTRSGQAARGQLFTSVQFDAARNLDPEHQLLLGGDNGLRGYPLRFRDGDRRVLATIEQRLYTDLEVLDVFHVGAAVFLDVGRAWYTGVRPGEADETLRNIGVGLRLGSSRSSQGTMIHLDVAFPLDGTSDERRGIQWLVQTKESF